MFFPVVERLVNLKSWLCSMVRTLVAGQESLVQVDVTEGISICVGVLAWLLMVVFKSEVTTITVQSASNIIVPLLGDVFLPWWERLGEPEELACMEYGTNTLPSSKSLVQDGWSVLIIKRSL
ncbi:hypothetical protein NPIL_548531 [Nephila pilipes]|uniref:Uncharacterized protein n=1 Tax=Nephila pilipes TaxID=299642 RepID=A0A8X6PGP6_NEPPI|nr:hypothetical protein NPIL_548531 [Nephila pilipes]